MNTPRRIEREDGSVDYKCSECGCDVDEQGQCGEGQEPCFYCPPEVCLCGRGFCDQSC